MITQWGISERLGARLRQEGIDGLPGSRHLRRVITRRWWAEQLTKNCGKSSIAPATVHGRSCAANREQLDCCYAA